MESLQSRGQQGRRLSVSTSLILCGFRWLIRFILGGTAGGGSCCVWCFRWLQNSVFLLFFPFSPFLFLALNYLSLVTDRRRTHARTHLLQPDNRQPPMHSSKEVNKQASTTVFPYRNKLSRHINLQSSNLSRIASYTLVRVPSQLHVWHSLMLRRNVSYRITSYSIPSFITMHAASCWPTDSAQRM